ncbi:MAG: hypothetical protein Q9204_006693, partial [Flavoplaca sp. TL-2023a]
YITFRGGRACQRDRPLFSDLGITREYRSITTVLRHEAEERAGTTVYRLLRLPVLLSLRIDENRKREGFVTIISPHKAGKQAAPAQEQAAISVVTNAIPIHADMPMGAPIIAALSDTTFLWS